MIDKSQDWVLLHGEENEFGTILKFARKLETCDNDDLTIDVSKYDIKLETTYSYILASTRTMYAVNLENWIVRNTC